MSLITRRHKRLQKDRGRKRKMRFRAAYANWIQERATESKKELEQYKVTNWVQGQRSRQVWIAGHVMRKKNGRWSKALIRWYDGTITRGNPPTIDWDHDIRNCFRRKYRDDHRTWQEIAMNQNGWAAPRPMHAADWQSNRYKKNEQQGQ